MHRILKHSHEAPDEVVKVSSSSISLGLKRKNPTCSPPSKTLKDHNSYIFFNLYIFDRGYKK